MPITDFSQLPSKSAGPSVVTDFSQLPVADTRLDLGPNPGLSFDTQPSFTSEAGGVPLLTKKGLREWKKYNTPGLPKPVSEEDLRVEPKRQVGFGEGLLTGSAELIDLIATGALAMPLAAAREQLTRVQRTVEKGVGFGRGKGMSRADISEEAAADAARINEKYGSPILSTLRNWGILDPRDSTPIEQGFGAAMERAGQLGENVEHASRGAVTKDDVLSLVNLTFGALGVAGVKAGAKVPLSRAKARAAAEWLQQVNNDASLRMTAEMQAGTSDFVETPSGRFVRPGDRTAETAAAAARAQAEEAAKADATRRKKAKEDARAAFLQEPGYMTAEEKSARGWDLNEADRAQRLAEGAAGERAAQLPPRAGDMRGGISAEAQSAMDKLARGKPLSLTDAERAALRLEALPSGKKGFAADPKLLTAAAIGATGLGLAMTYEPDPTEAALAIGAGALMLGKGKGLTLEAIRTAADDTPLRAFRDASSTTLNTLENLPGNRSVFSKQSIAELLKRAEVTKAERDVLQPILDSVPGETITAKQLMAGVKERTGDFELKPVESAQYADYGLANIDRLERSMMGQEDWIPEGATPAEEAAAQAAAKARFDAAPISTTTIYRSPVELGTNNHFNDPNYFAHTRSFEEGGIKHVVELQSDLAQKAGKVLGEEEKATLTEQLKDVHRRSLTLEEAHTASNMAGQRFSSTDVATSLQRFLSALGDLEIDYKLRIGEEIFRRAESVGAESFLNRVEQRDPGGRAGHMGNYDTVVDQLIDDLKNRPNEQATRTEVYDLLEPALYREVHKMNVLRDELKSKLKESGALDPIRPMLKNWHKRLVREELASAAQKGEPTVRFATADTVAKVEGWPEQGADALARAERMVRLAEQNVADARQNYPQTVRAAERELAEMQEALTEAKERAGSRFSPEHQGIYDRYAGDVEKFLKQLGGKPYTDSAGHTWLEVPVEGSKKMPAGPRAQQFGLGQTGLMAALATIGVGIAAGKWIEQYLSDNENSKGKIGATLGAVVSGLAVLVASKHSGLSDFARAAASKLDYTFGALETRLGNMSQALLRRLTDFEFQSMKRAHESGIAFAPFVEAWKAVKKGPEKEALRAALLTNEPGKILPALGRAGSPALVEAYKAAIAGQLEIGKELQKYGLLKDLRPEYFTRMVIDYPELRKAMGKDDGNRLDALIKAAELRSVKLTGAPLSPVEVSNITNKFLTSGEYRGIGKKAGFLRKRVIGEVTQEFAKYYASPDEGLLLYARAASNAIEKARLFKDFEVKDPVTGKINLEASIGNMLAAEKAAGRVSPEQVQELHRMLLHRFGPGEHSMAGWLQDIRNTTNMFLLGNPYAGIAQVGDIYTNVAANRLLPTIYAAAQLVGRKANRVTLRDMGIVNHIAEELTGTRATAKLLDKALKTGLSPVDTLGKSLFLNGKLRDFQQQSRTASGVRNLTDRYAEYFGPKDFPQLMSDLRAGVRSPLVDAMLFRELSNVQPITKLAMSELALKHPNARILFMLRSFQLKQIDILRREAYNEIRKGFETGERHRVLRGVNRLMRFGMALGVSGATSAAVMDFLYGKDVDVSIGDVLLNATKVFGLSQYTLAALDRGERLEAIASMAMPPWRVWEQIVTGDPKALRYLPLIGPYVYWHGTEAGQEQREREVARKAREEAKQ